MNTKYIGSSVFDDIKKWEKEESGFSQKLNDHVEKRKLAAMLSEIREKEHLTQSELAKKANVTQSVIARIETGSSRTLPRLDLMNRIFLSVGYETHIVVRKKGFILDMPLTA